VKIMRSVGRVARFAIPAAFALIVVACGDDDDNGNTPTPTTASYSDVQSLLVADCAGCHDAGSGRVFLTTMDSAALLNSGVISPSAPSSSLLIRKPTGATPHGGGIIASFTTEDQAVAEEWIALNPTPAANDVEAIKIGAGTSIPVPTVDGFFDEVWASAPAMSYVIGGGWSDATTVQLQAAYDDTYLYMLVSWSDDVYSDRRQPWAKQADGSWRVLAAKSPAPTSGTNWAAYISAGPFDEEDPTRFAYEDKLALIWNTYGASTVAGFDESGCAMLCHDPASAEGPGTSYNTDQAQAAKKFTNAAGEIADMWHWKMVRNNQHKKADDQYVGYWARGATGASGGGRFNDAGTAGYGENPALNGKPTYRGPSIAVPPYYIFDNQKVALTDDELLALPTGAEIANMITAGPTGGRADVDAAGLHNNSSNRWSLEIRRRLVTGEDKDVQFNDLTRSYSFGVAVFDNAQIEHSYTSSVARLKFRP
jgi:hypothetical protein